MSEDLFSVGYGERITLICRPFDPKEVLHQITLEKSKFGTVSVYVIIDEERSFYALFEKDLMTTLHMRYWHEPSFDVCGPMWIPVHFPGEYRFLQTVNKKDIDKAIEIMQKVENEHMRKDVKRYFSHLLKVLKFLSSKEGQKFIEDNCEVKEGSYDPDPEMKKKIEEIYKQLNAI